LRPYRIRLVIANVKISEDALEISILGRPAPEEVLEKLRAPGMHSPRRSEISTWLPGLMSQSAVVRDYRALETGRRRTNRLVLTVAEWPACRGLSSPTGAAMPLRPYRTLR
jgi:hypothetical protein